MAFQIKPISVCHKCQKYYFFPRDALQTRPAVMRCVCLSEYVSVTFVHSVKTNGASAYGTPLDGATVKVVITTVNKT